MTNKKLISAVAALIGSTTFIAMFAMGDFFALAQEDADTTPPTDVESVTAQAGDGQVLLEWPAATDNIRVVGYKVYRGTQPVKSQNGVYNMPPLTVNAVTKTTVPNLTNGQTYYFTVTALDAQNNESLNYATEVSATPAAGKLLASTQDDGRAPEIMSVKSEDVITVLVTFSEAVKLPEEHPSSAFTIKKAEGNVTLEIQKAEIDARDTDGKTVLLTTAPQENGAKYVVTAGIEIKDFYDNSIVSGTSDTGQFTGSNKEARPTVTATAPSAPEETDPKAETTSPLLDTTSGPHPSNPLESVIVRKKSNQKALAVKNVTLSLDAKTMFITTDKQEATEYEVRVPKIKDVEGNEILAGSDVVTITGRRGSNGDLVPPEDVTKLIARVKSVKDSIVELRWKGSANSAGDLADQLLYQGDGKDASVFGEGASMGTSTESVEVHSLKPGSWYTFKVSTKDTSDNESKGVLAAIYLPETGPGVVAAGLTGIAMAWYRKKKKSQK